LSQKENEVSSGEENENKKTGVWGINFVKGLFSKKKEKSDTDAQEKTKEAKAAPFGAFFKSQRVDLRGINVIFSFILVVLIIVIIYYTSNKKYSIEAITKAVSKINLQSVKKKTMDAIKPIDFYLDQIRSRDFFKKFALPVEIKKVEISEEDQDAIVLEESQDELTKIVEDLKVSGISFGVRPRVMIRSEAEQEMYFLRQGQAIGKTGAIIKEIFRDKVIISYNGAEMELL